MGFLLGSFCLSQTPICQSLRPPFISSSQRKNGKKKMAAIASLHPENPNDSNFMKRRVFLLVGLSALPLLQSRALAIEGLKEKQDIPTAEVHPQNLEVSSPQQDQIDQLRQQEASANPFAVLNGIGIIGFGVLGALYALTKKEMTTFESTIESMKSKLSEKDAAMAMLEKNFKRRLQSEEEERIEQIRKIKEEQASLSNQMASANNALTESQRELHSKKQLAQDLKAQTDHLQSVIAQAGEDKKTLETELKKKQDAADVLQERINLLSLEIKDKEKSIKNLNLSLAGKESECKKLTSICNQTKEDLAQANSVVEGLKGEVLKTREELELKKSLEEDLNTRIKLVLAERDEIKKKIHAFREEYNDLKSSSEKRAASDSELLSNKDHELNQLKEKVGIAVNEASSYQALITELTREGDSLRIMLEKEANTLKNLRGEIQITQETLGVSRLETADLAKQLKESKRSCEELTSEVSRIQTEFAEAQKSLNWSLDEVKSSSQVLSDELVSVKEALAKTKQELLVMTDELKDVTGACENLKKELLEVYKKAETTARDLKEERKVATSLNKELEELKKEILNDKDARRKIERDLEEANKSLDEMNRNALLLSRELEITNSKGTNLETEKDALYLSLVEQKDVAKGVLEILEDAHNLVTKLGKEKESLEKRGKRLEEELASTKGEILRLRREFNSIRSTGNEQHPQKSSGAEDGAPVVVKRSGRRRKGGPASEVSQ